MLEKKNTNQWQQKKVHKEKEEQTNLCATIVQNKQIKIV